MSILVTWKGASVRLYELQVAGNSAHALEVTTLDTVRACGVGMLQLRRSKGANVANASCDPCCKLVLSTAGR